MDPTRGSRGESPVCEFITCQVLYLQLLSLNIKTQIWTASEKKRWYLQRVFGNMKCAPLTGLAATEYPVFPLPFYRILISFRWPGEQSKTTSQPSPAVHGHPMVWSRFYPMKCKQWESVFKRGSKRVGLGHFSHTTLLLSCLEHTDRRAR